MRHRPPLHRMREASRGRPRGVDVKQTSRSTAAAALHGADAAAKGRADVSRVRERTRKRRLTRLIIFLALFDGYLWYRFLTDNPFQMPTLGPEAIIWMPVMVLLFAIVLMMMM